MTVCSVPGCFNYYPKASFDITWHRFPKNEAVRKEWILKIRRNSDEITQYMYVCSAHFKPSDFKPLLHAKNRYLKPGAVPSVFQWNSDKKMMDFSMEMATIPQGDVDASDFYHLFTSFVRGKVSREILNNCQLLYKCKACQEVTSSIQNYIEHFRQCVKKLENESANLTNSRTAELKDGDPVGLIENKLRTAENIGSECDREFGSNNRKATRSVKFAYKCKSCDYESISASDCRKHAQIVHRENTFSRKNFSKIFVPPNAKSRLTKTDIVKKCPVGNGQNGANPTVANDHYYVVLDRRHEDKVNFDELSCRLCGKTFENSYALRQHLAVIHLGHEKYKCRLCEFRSTATNKCMEHSVTEHDVNCITMGDLRTNFYELTVGASEKSKGRDVKGRSTSKKNDDPSEKSVRSVRERLGTKETKETDETRAESDYCVVLGDEHKDKVDSTRGFCLLCEKTFGNESRLRQHLAVVHLGHKKHKCKICEFKSSTMTECTEHAATVHKIKWFASSEFRKYFYDLKCVVVPGTTDPTAGTRIPDSNPVPNSGAPKRKGVVPVRPSGSRDQIVADDSNYVVVLEKNYEDVVDLERKFCLKCNKNYCDAYSLRQHLAVTHLGFARFKCRTCDFMASSLMRCREHSKEVHDIDCKLRDCKKYYRELSVVTPGTKPFRISSLLAKE